MKKFIVMVAIGIGASLATPHCEAGDIDFRTGSFDGNWCGFSARFDITKRRGKSFVFDGKILIRSTDQYDKIVVTQLEDDSLHIVRFLSGAHAGETQVMQTHPPETLIVAGKTRVNFPAKRTFGFGAKLAGFLRMPQN